MRKFGLIGYPLGHSFSSRYFTEKFQREHILECSYDNYPLKDIAEIISLIKNEPDLSGLNVTIPYKSEIIPFLNSVSIEAAEIGAVNVVKIRRSEQGFKLFGFNSDVTGIMDTLLPNLENYKGSAIILGTGGAGKAIRYALIKMGMVVTSVSRKPAPEVITYQQLTSEKLSTARLIVNATPLGMFPNVNSCPDINYDLLRKDQILFDLVYNPEQTLFLQKGMERGCTTIGGINMLHSQAERAWEIWNDDDL